MAENDLKKDKEPKEVIKKNGKKTPIKHVETSGMEGKDIVIGVLLIAIVGLAGGLGYMAATMPTECEDCEDCDEEDEVIWREDPTPLTGLPTDWSTAPNKSAIFINNGTHFFNITFEEILDLIAVGRVYDEKYDYRKRLFEKTVTDQASGLPITGVDLLEILWVKDTYFAGGLECVSEPDSHGINDTIELDVKKMVNKMYESPKESIIVGLAANGTWLADSSIGTYSGNFSIFGTNMDSTLYKLQNITVTANWTIDVYVDNTLEMSLQPYNLTSNPTNHNIF